MLPQHWAGAGQRSPTSPLWPPLPQHWAGAGQSSPTLPLQPPLPQLWAGAGGRSRPTRAPQHPHSPLPQLLLRSQPLVMVVWSECSLRCRLCLLACSKRCCCSMDLASDSNSDELPAEGVPIVGGTCNSQWAVKHACVPTSCMLCLSAECRVLLQCRGPAQDGSRAHYLVVGHHPEVCMPLPSRSQSTQCLIPEVLLHCLRCLLLQTLGSPSPQGDPGPRPQSPGEPQSRGASPWAVPCCYRPVLALNHVHCVQWGVKLASGTCEVDDRQLLREGSWGGWWLCLPAAAHAANNA
jgi:hypothetical protein